MVEKLYLKVEGCGVKAVTTLTENHGYANGLFRDGTNRLSLVARFLAMGGGPGGERFAKLDERNQL